MKTIRAAAAAALFAAGAAQAQTAPQAAPADRPPAVPIKASKIILVGLICFFPTFVNAFTGFRGADPNLVDLYRAFGAGRWRIITLSFRL